MALVALAEARCQDPVRVPTGDAAQSVDVSRAHDGDTAARVDAAADGTRVDAAVDGASVPQDGALPDVLACPTGTADCDRDQVCETALAVSVRHCGACGEACTDDALCVDGRCVMSRVWPRAPISSTRTGSRQPILRWVNSRGATGARVEVCASRDCGRVEGSWEVTGTSLRVPVALTPGVHFWRLFAMEEARADAAPGPVWEFEAPALNAYPRHDARAYGSLATPAMRPLGDVNGDGYGDYGGSLVVGADDVRGILWFGHRGGVTRLVTPAYTSAGCVSAGDLNGDGMGDCWFTTSQWVSGFVYQARPSLGGEPWLEDVRLPREMDSIHFWGAFDASGLTSAAAVPTHVAASASIETAGRDRERLRAALMAMRERASVCGPEVGVLFASEIVAADWNRDGYDDLRMYRVNGTHWVEVDGSADGLVMPPRCADSGRLARPFGVPSPCPEGREVCADRCVDLLRDAANCGTCENACAAGGACVGGRCAP